LTTAMEMDSNNDEASNNEPDHFNILVKPYGKNELIEDIASLLKSKNEIAS